MGGSAVGRETTAGIAQAGYADLRGTHHPFGARVRLGGQAPREPRVYAMGDKSPRSKDKNKKQGASKKAKAKAKRDKKQAPQIAPVKKA